jgi:uncharacterized membrane protein
MAAVSTPQPAPRRRLEAVDVVRGVIMILMALDHTRDFFGMPGANPVNLLTTTPELFFTRWVTHICAPVFFLLTGTGAFLSLRRKSVSELSRFLLTRGLWLIFLDLFLVRCFGFQFNVDYHVTLLLVLWALGWSMITLSALVHLPTRYVTAFGVVLVAGHNLLDGLRITSPIWTILHVPGFVINRPGFIVFAAYPLIPWIGVMALGYGLGQAYGWEPERRRTVLLRLGVALSVAFLALRAINIYGDASHWAPQRSAVMTVISFLNTTKYPPSLLFLLMTLGPALLFLRAVDGATPRALRPALVFGKVPLFYYILHLLIIHLIAIGVSYARYGAVHWFFESPNLGNYPFTAPPGWGYSLSEVYLVWAIVVIAAYPLCRKYAALKAQSASPWLSYL